MGLSRRESLAALGGALAALVAPGRGTASETVDCVLGVSFLDYPDQLVEIEAVALRPDS